MAKAYDSWHIGYHDDDKENCTIVNYNEGPGLENPFSIRIPITSLIRLRHTIEEFEVWMIRNKQGIHAPREDKTC